MMLKTHLFGFMNTPVRDVGQNHKVAAWSLKVECWISLIVAALVAFFGVLLSIGLLVGGAFAGGALESFGWWNNAVESAVALGTLASIIVFFVTVFAVGIMGLWLWWANTTYMKWNEAEEGAVVWANVFGAVLVLFSFGGIFNVLSGDPTAGSNVASLIIGILILVFANMANSRGELDEGATLQDGAEAV